MNQPAPEAPEANITDKTIILPLDSSVASLEVVGGKGANLARLTAGGYPVPPGFLVSTAAYRAYVAHNDLAGAIDSTLAGLAPEDPAALEAASRAIRQRFAAGALPEELAAALGEAYAGLGSPPVAVRSSATAEDLPDLSFAGQQDTYLNVVGADALLEAVVGCWSSLWTARAIGYRLRQGIGHDDLALAVVVQEMVAAEAAGVLFTASPLDGKRTEMMIEAALGLGEVLVSGQVEPDRYRVDAASGRILSKMLGAKARSIRPRQGGGTVTRAEEAAGRQALPDAAIAELARLGGWLDALFGAPQDVEWAWDGARLHLLQTRPITSLFPVPKGMGPEPLQVLFSFAAAQGVMDPITPLGRDAVRAVFAGAGATFGYRARPETQGAVYEAAERLWINITALLRNRVGRRLIHSFLGIVEQGVQQALDVVLEDPRLAVTGGPRLRTVRRLLGAVLPNLGRLVQALLRPEAARARFHRELEAQLAAVEARAAGARTLAERVAFMETAIAAAFPVLLPRFLPGFGPGIASLNILIHLGRQVPGGEQDALEVTRGLPHNVTTEMDLALWAVAVEIRASEAALAHFQDHDAGVLAAEYLAAALPAPAQAAVTRFLARYGMRGVGEIDLGRPRWREDPRPVMQTLQSYLQIEDPDQAPDAAFARGATAAGAAVERLTDRVRATPGGRFKARRVRWAARRVRALVGLREAPKFWAVRIMGLVRAGLLDSGRELVEASTLARPDDLFMLRLPELRALAAGEARDWQALVGERRAIQAREARRSQVPRLLLSDGRAFYEGVVAPDAAPASADAAPASADGNGAPDGVLAGSPVSPGVVEGRVRVVLDPQAAALAPGEILVCPGTDPAWTPLFLVAGGLVTEVGGLMTHGSVVAREYGIPAVVGVTGATTRLETGQRVRVDGSGGRVTVLEPDGETSWRLDSRT
jgi:pyruvate,water dikinase